ncbi:MULTISPECIES: sarcosine oxidase subunit gamma family protein [unclassified Thalassospira]|uniref:sarcosine oxidase subunit gamma n=1 Tax=unclassified Thalassospira TaxID=2648997 RepID=UPI0007A5C908|nr:MULTISPECIES: sarcosine oxidase subunit gamma family protein [unclassified Thalassospira]KZC99218.1 sarcosine oxidase subunit gamma [Thalassospira sp. MCCC 1A02898]ONH88491.1 sarcosine oxidase subunit gamma [Thalassospira sp. MCCC 1A02803]
MTVLTHAFTPGPIVASGPVKLTLMAPVARFSLRLRAANIPAVSKAIGVDLATTVGARAANGTTESICLGPDEWLIIAKPDDAETVTKACADVYASATHSLTEVSAREVTVRIEGERASELLTIGCPRDIDSIPVGGGCRTVIDGVTVVLWRDAEQSFRMDIWRSFALHIIDLLCTGCKEFAAE